MENLIKKTAKDLQREYLRQWRNKNRDHINAYHRQWCRNNPEKVQAIHERYWEKKARKSLEVCCGN